MSRKSALVAMFISLVLIGGACSRANDSAVKAPRGSEVNDSGGTRSGAPSGAQVEGSTGKDMAVEPAPADDASGIATSPKMPELIVPPVPDLPPTGAKVIKNANIEVRVKKGAFADRFDQASMLAQEMGGYVTNTSVNETKGKVSSGTITIRIPSERFQAAMSRLKKFGKVTTENQSGQDVSKEFVDLEARLRHAKSQEGFYLRLLDDADSVSDLVQVQQQLSAVQLQIEEIQGQLQFLKDQTVYSSISARIFEPGAAATPAKPEGLSGAWERAVDSFESVLGAGVVAMGWLAPFALLSGAGYLVWRLTRRTKSPAGLPPASEGPA